MDRIEQELKDYLEKQREIDAVQVPERLLQKAKSLMPSKNAVLCPHCGKPVTPFKKPLRSQKLLNAVWLILAVAGFALSFVVPRYFIQFVALGFLSAVKWIVDQKATRTQILIYKALKEGSEEEHRSLHKHPSRL